MAMVKTNKPLPSSIMLKDYLLDDLSSCSSNGFRSYPRKQCCATTVRFLLEIDLRNRESNGQRKRLLETKPPPPTTKISAFQRASEAVIHAVKLFRFSSPSKSKQIATKRSSILPRSLSRKLLKRSFWKRSKEVKIERLKSFQYYLDQKEPQPSVLPRSSTIAVSTATAAAKIAAADSTSESNSHSNNSWSSSEFTSDYLQCSSGNSESSCGNDVVEGEKEVSGGKIGATVGADSMEGATNSTKHKSKWPKEEEKEQFSPVSVLDIPFGDDEEEEEELASPFQSRLIRVEGTKQKMMQKLQRFEGLAKLEPVALENRFSLSEYTHESLNHHHHQSAPKTLQEDKENETENKVLDLLDQITCSIPSHSFKFLEDSLVLDFFKERVAEAESCTKSFEQRLLVEANDWISGNPQQLFMGWEVQKNRQVYLRDMEKGGRWRENMNEHREVVAMELEVEVFASLVNEVFHDLVSS